jgi:quercetin dioxygenase-like cupin family protein/DNA-binding XRE family transcriptional regulator
VDPALAAAIGERLRAARDARGLTLSALAGRAGVGKGSLSEIEHGIRNPTLSTLYAFAGSQVASPGIGARLLDATRHEDGTVEVYLLHLEPGAAHRAGAHGPGVVEHLLVTHGRVRVGVLGREVEAGPGDTAVWVSDAEHGYEALGPTPVEAVLTIRTPMA